MEIEFQGERLGLLSERALWWPRRSALLVADLHVGKDAAFRAAAIPIPRMAFESDLARLSAAIKRTGARRLIVLGDLAHHRSGWTPTVVRQLAEWRETHARTEITLLRGNHDDHAGDPPSQLKVDCVSGAMEAPPFVLSHQVEFPHAYAITGHLHPAVKLRRKGVPTATLPCFYFGQTYALLPAFGSFTGCAVIQPKEGERVFAIAEQEVVEISTSASR